PNRGIGIMAKRARRLSAEAASASDYSHSLPGPELGFPDNFWAWDRQFENQQQHRARFQKLLNFLGDCEFVRHLSHELRACTNAAQRGEVAEQVEGRFVSLDGVVSGVDAGGLQFLGIPATPRNATLYACLGWRWENEKMTEQWELCFRGTITTLRNICRQS